MQDKNIQTLDVFKNRLVALFDNPALVSNCQFKNSITLAFPYAVDELNMREIIKGFRNEYEITDGFYENIRSDNNDYQGVFAFEIIDGKLFVGQKDRANDGSDKYEAYMHLLWKPESGLDDDMAEMIGISTPESLNTYSKLLEKIEAEEDRALLNTAIHRTYRVSNQDVYMYVHDTPDSRKYIRITQDMIDSGFDMFYILEIAYRCAKYDISHFRYPMKAGDVIVKFDIEGSPRYILVTESAFAIRYDF